MEKGKEMKGFQVLYKPLNSPHANPRKTEVIEVPNICKLTVIDSVTKSQVKSSQTTH